MKYLDTIFKKKFILTIGDDGAILLYIEKGKIKEQLFTTSLEETGEFSELLEKNKKVPIYIYLDTMEQNYDIQTLPPVSRFALKNIINRKLDNKSGDIQKAYKVGRNDQYRKDWLYLFISIANSSILFDWIKYIQDFPNRFKGVYLLPLETTKLISELGKEQKSRWKLFISHNKVGGFRQIILRDGRLLLTRLTQPLENQNPEIMAGNVEQETRNTIEYLKRFSLGDNESIDMYFIYSEKIKEVMDLEQFEIHNTFSFTPYEAAQRLGIADNIAEDEKYGDVLLASYFAKTKKPILKLFDKLSAQINKLYNINFYAKVATCLVVPAFAIYISLTSNNVYTFQKDMKFLEGEKQKATQGFQKVQKDSREIPIDIDNITNILSLYETISVGANTPLPLISKFKAISTEEVLVYSLSWSSTDLIRAVKKEIDVVETAKFRVKLLKDSNDIDEISKAADKFVKNLQKNLPSYNVKMLDLPGIFQSDETWQETIGNKSDITNIITEQIRNMEILISG